MTGTPEDEARELERLQPISESAQRQLSQNARRVLAEHQSYSVVATHLERDAWLVIEQEDQHVMSITTIDTPNEPGIERRRIELRIVDDIVATKDRRVITDSKRMKVAATLPKDELGETSHGDAELCQEFFDHPERFTMDL